MENNEDDEDNDKRTVGEDKITGVYSDNNKGTGVKSESTVVAGENDESDDMALIEETIAEAEREIAEGTELFARNADKGTPEEANGYDREDTWDKRVIRPDTQLPMTENVYNLIRHGN